MSATVTAIRSGSACEFLQPVSPDRRYLRIGAPRCPRWLLRPTGVVEPPDGLPPGLGKFRLGR